MYRFEIWTKGEANNQGVWRVIELKEELNGFLYLRLLEVLSLSLMAGKRYTGQIDLALHARRCFGHSIRLSYMYNVRTRWLDAVGATASIVRSM